MSDMHTSIDYRVDGSHISTAHDFEEEGAGGAEPSAELPSGYVSDAELLAWLQTKSTGQYDDLRDQMKISTERQDLIMELKNLQSAIAKTRTEDGVEAIKGKIEGILSNEKYAPYAADLTALLGHTLEVLNFDTGNPVVDEMDESTTNVGTLALLNDPITNLTDKLGKVDSLALVQIQQLMADAKETSQLASNVLSSRDQTSGSIIGNIRG